MFSISNFVFRRYGPQIYLINSSIPKIYVELPRNAPGFPISPEFEFDVDSALLVALLMRLSGVNFCADVCVDFSWISHGFRVGFRFFGCQLWCVFGVRKSMRENLRGFLVDFAWILGGFSKMNKICFIRQISEICKFVPEIDTKIDAEKWKSTQVFHAWIFGSNVVVKSGIQIDTGEFEQESQSQTAAAREVQSWSWRSIMPSRAGTLHPFRCGRMHPVAKIVCIFWH